MSFKSSLFFPALVHKLISVLPQTFRLFEKLAEQDRARALSELQRREESRCVPPAVHELEVTAEPGEDTKEEQGAEEVQVEGAAEAAPAPAASEAPAVSEAPAATAGPQPVSNSSSGGAATEGEQAAAAGTQPAGP